MRAWLICTHSDDFWPVEEVLTEGGYQQSIEEHVAIFTEEHRPRIRLFFPEHVTDRLTDTELGRLQAIGDDCYEAAEIIALYENTIR